MEIVFVTNNPGEPAAAYASGCAGMGIPVAEERVRHRRAGDGAAGGGAGRGERHRLRDRSAGASRRWSRQAGLEVLEGEAGRGADAVLVSGHRDFDYEELLTATLALQRGAALFATSRDPTLPMPGGAWPGTGAILAAVETASGATARDRRQARAPPVRAGPRAWIAQARERVAMVGDRIASDIEGGRRAGLETILVLSGATSREEAEAADPPPDHVLDDLAGLLR